MMSGKKSHGLSYTPEYRAWQTLRQRCLNPSNRAYPDYGGRGITVYAGWVDDPQAFIDHVGLRPSPLHELDREDNNKGYEPGNCRWVTRRVNSRNRRSNRVIDHQGEALTLTEWAERTGVPVDTLHKRLASGWSTAAALEAPVRSKAPKGAAVAENKVCIGCGQTGVYGTRCITCSNKSRAKRPKPNQL